MALSFMEGNEALARGAIAAGRWPETLHICNHQWNLTADSK